MLKKCPRRKRARCSLHLLSKMSITKLLHRLICKKHTVHYFFFLTLNCCTLHISPVNNVSPTKRGWTLQRANEDRTGGLRMDPQKGVLVPHHNSWDGMSLPHKQTVPKDWLCSIMQETGHVQTKSPVTTKGQLTEQRRRERGREKQRMQTAALFQNLVSRLCRQRFKGPFTIMENCSDKVNYVQ